MLLEVRTLSNTDTQPRNHALASPCVYVGTLLIIDVHGTTEKLKSWRLLIKNLAMRVNEVASLFSLSIPLRRHLYPGIIASSPSVRLRNAQDCDVAERLQ